MSLFHVLPPLFSLGRSMISTEGDTSVSPPLDTTIAPTGSGTGTAFNSERVIGRFLLGGHQHMIPPRSITIPPSQTRGTSGLTKTRMVASEAPFQSARKT